MYQTLMTRNCHWNIKNKLFSFEQPNRQEQLSLTPQNVSSIWFKTTIEQFGMVLELAEMGSNGLDLSALTARRNGRIGPHRQR